MNDASAALTGDTASGAASGGAGSSGAVSRAGHRPLPPFDEEIRDAVRYERGLLVKALLALSLVAIIVILRALYFI